MTPKHRQTGNRNYSEIMKKKLWTARDISIVLSCSRQRVYDYAEIYGWEPVYDTPLLWTPNEILNDREEILERRSASPQGWLKQEREEI